MNSIILSIAFNHRRREGRRKGGREGRKEGRKEGGLVGSLEQGPELKEVGTMHRKSTNIHKNIKKKSSIISF